MKTHIIHVISVGAVMLVTACVQNLLVAPEATKTTRLTARMEFQPETKTVLSEQVGDMYYPLWADRDSLSVFTETGQMPSAFTLCSGAGETNAIFEGPRSGERYVALFPFNSQAQWEGNVLNFSLPEKQSYRVNSFALDGFPMIAVSETADLQFKNLCSVIRLSLTGSGVVGSITLHSDSQFLSGPASVDLTYGDSPVLVMGDGGSHDVRLECSAVMLNKETAKDFYIVLPPASYEGLTITVDAYTERVTKSITHEVVLSRSELRPVTPFMVEAPMIDLDNLPNDQIWYKTQEGTIFSPENWKENPPFDARIVSHSYEGGYGVVLFDGPVKEIKEWAFRPSPLIELHLPDCVERINERALPNLATFRIPANINYIGVENLLEIDSVYGPMVAEDGRSVVSNGTLICIAGHGQEEYHTPEGVLTVGGNGIWGTSFKKFIVSEGVRVVDDYAFYSSHIEEIYLPESLETIGRQDFIYGLKGYYGNPRFTTEDHLCLINPKGMYGSSLVGIASNDAADYFTIPEGITDIAAPFWGWPNLRRIRIPESFSMFSHYGIIGGCPVFEGFDGPNVSEDGRCLIKNGVVKAIYAVGIKEYTTPTGAQTIGQSCLFAFCRAEIENLIVSEGVQELKDYCFETCSSLRSVTLPTTIKRIGYQVFNEDEKLESVYLPVRIPPIVASGPNRSSLPKLKVYVPEESYDDYLADSYWSRWSQYLAPYHFDNIDPPAPYESSDFSTDGKVTVLQTASEGKGIDLVLMGDAFSDRMIADGRYLAAMEKMEETFFAIEPYRSFRHLFNVYAVNVVSPSEDYTSGNLALDFNFVANNGYADANPDKCFEYALKAIPDERLDEATIIVVGNTIGVDSQGGSCSMWTRSKPTTDYGTGIGLAVFGYPWGQAIIQHEAGGHGFAKLQDEYTSRAQGNEYALPEEEREYLREQQQAGWWKNVDFTADPTQVRWSYFLTDPRYEKERLGIYEGAGMFYTTGIYRPSDDSLMNSGQGGFNAPSREAIYYRIHKLAYGPDWEYDYEKFVEYDQGAKNIHPTAAKMAPASRKNYEVRDPLPVTSFNPKEWTVTTME